MSLQQVAEEALTVGSQPVDPAPVISVAEVLAAALADVQSTRAAWTNSDLVRAVSDALPDRLDLTSGADLTTVLDRLAHAGQQLAVPLDTRRPAEAVLPGELRLADGSSAYQQPGAQLFATPEHIHTEPILMHANTQPTARRMGLAAAAALAQLEAAGIMLGPDQRVAVHGVLTSGAAVESLVGPAGTGEHMYFTCSPSIRMDASRRSGKTRGEQHLTERTRTDTSPSTTPKTGAG